MFKGYTTKTILVVVCVLPLLFLAGLSVSQQWVFPAILPKRFTTENWADAFSETGGIGQSLVLTLVIAMGVALVATIAGFFSSRFIAYHRRKRSLLFLAYLPFVLSPVIFAVCLKFYFIKMGFAGKTFGVLLAQMIHAFPYSVIFFTGFWNRPLRQYETLVETLGGSARDALYRVILPAAKPMLLVCFFQCFLIAWFDYGLTSVIGYGRVQTLTIKVYQFVTESNIYLAALSCCLLVVPPVVLLWINKQIIFRQAN